MYLEGNGLAERTLLELLDVAQAEKVVTAFAGYRVLHHFGAYGTLDRITRKCRRLGIAELYCV